MNFIQILCILNIYKMAARIKVNSRLYYFYTTISKLCVVKYVISCVNLIKVAFESCAKLCKNIIFS